MKLRRLLPGSVTRYGGVVDYLGFTHLVGPIFVPLSAMRPERKAYIGAAGVFARQNTGRPCCPLRALLASRTSHILPSVSSVRPVRY